MTQTRKQKLKSLIKKYKRTLKQRGGKKKMTDESVKMFNGIMESIKLLIANKIALLVNWQVTSRLNNRILRGLPQNAKDILESKITNVAKQMSTDMALKGLDTGENVMRAVPAFGNVISLVSAGDKAIAGMKNARTALLDIKAEIEGIKQSLIVAGFDPKTDFPFLDSIPDIPPIPFMDQIESVLDSATGQTGGQIKQKDEPHPATYKKVIARTKDSIKSFNY